MSEGFSLTQQEAELLARAMLLAGGAVALAKFSGARGTTQEFNAIVEEMAAIRSEQPHNPVFAALPVDLVAAEAAGMARDYQIDPKQTTFQQYKMAALNRVSQAHELLDEKAAPEYTAAYRQAVLRICERVAGESKEGGFLGMGGTAVDIRETGVIGEISRVLGL